MIEQDMALTNEKPLQSWKEIAAYLQRDERTARRWEKEEGLPVRRHRQDGRGTVYAYASELDAWRLARKPRAADAEAEAEGARGTRWPKWLAPAAACLALAAAVLAVRYGPILNPPRPLVEAAGEVVASRVVWEGEGVDGKAAPTPDGRYVAATDAGSGDLVLRELRTGAVRRLAAGVWSRSRAFSHDGKWLAHDAGKPGARTLRLLSVGDGASRTIWARPGAQGVEVWGWLPDDRAVLAAWDVPEGRVLALVGVDGSERRLDLGGATPLRAALSPDGRWVAYDSRQPGPAGIRVANLEGSTEHTVMQGDAGESLLGWGKSGLLFTRGRGGATDLLLLPVYQGMGAGEAVVLRRDAGEVVAGQFDGRGRFYYGVGGRQARLWAIEWTGEGGASR